MVCFESKGSTSAIKADWWVGRRTGEKALHGYLPRYSGSILIYPGSKDRQPRGNPNVKRIVYQ